MLGPPPVYEGYGQAILSVSSPIGSTGVCFGRHLEGERDNLDRIMRLLNAVASDRDAYLLVSWGIEGEQWEWSRTVEGAHPVQLPAFEGSKEQEALPLNVWDVLRSWGLMGLAVPDPRVDESRRSIGELTDRHVLA